MTNPLDRAFLLVDVDEPDLDSLEELEQAHQQALDAMRERCSWCPKGKGYAAASPEVCLHTECSLVGFFNG